jgi:FdhD protein
MNGKVETAISTPVTVRQSGMDERWQNDDIAVEVPVALVYNCISHAVMMATPSDLADFALGFSLTEDIVHSPGEVSHIHQHNGTNGITMRLQITDECFEALRTRRRNMVGRTGCGLCGTETLKQAIRPVEPVEAVEVSDEAVQHALGAINRFQPLQQATGATHAAAWCDLEGNILLVREDVGRHNALDKLIGALAKQDADKRLGFVLVTSRASYEMVQKAAKAGMGCLVAVSAPTSLAIEQAQLAGLKLIGFARDRRHVVYHDPAIIHQHDARKAL